MVPPPIIPSYSITLEDGTDRLIFTCKTPAKKDKKNKVHFPERQEELVMFVKFEMDDMPSQVRSLQSRRQTPRNNITPDDADKFVWKKELEAK